MIELQNAADRERERQAALNLKAAKKAEHEATLAAHQQREDMEILMAQNERALQEEHHLEVMEWEEQQATAAKAAAAEQQSIFNANLGLRQTGASMWNVARWARPPRRAPVAAAPIIEAR